MSQHTTSWSRADGGPTGDEIPRWLVVSGLVVAAAAIVILARYAIDLLGAVCMIVLAGMSLRAVSDWFSEGDSTSGWAIGSVAASLVGTLLIGGWLLGSPQLGANSQVQKYVPRALYTAIAFAESHGWGRRALLPGGPLDHAHAEAATSGTSESGSAAASPAKAAPGSPNDRPRDGDSARRSPAAPTRKTGAQGGGAGRSSPRSRPPARQDLQNTTPAVASGPAQAVDDAQAIVTSVVLRTAQPTTRAGISVRLTARVTASNGVPPRGRVLFRAGAILLGSVPVDADGCAAISILTLPVGSHEVLAEFAGMPPYTGSRSQPLVQTVVR